MTLTELLQRAAETHHMVWMKEEGNDPDWPIWYADWLIDHSVFLEILGRSMTKTTLVCMFVDMDKTYTSLDSPDQTWQEYYAERLMEVGVSA